MAYYRFERSCCRGGRRCCAQLDPIFLPWLAISALTLFRSLSCLLEYVNALSYTLNNDRLTNFNDFVVMDVECATISTTKNNVMSIWSKFCIYARYIIIYPYTIVCNTRIFAESECACCNFRIWSTQ